MTGTELFSDAWACGLGHSSVSAPFFQPERIILAKGSTTTPERELLVRWICSAYPGAAVDEQLDTPHNRIKLEASDPLELHRRGKRTLVLGELKSAVRFSEESANTCPNYWHFSLYGFCPYGCRYCYLAGTHGVWFSPTVKIYVNLSEVIEKIDQVARRIGRPMSFYHGKLQDALALDPLTGYMGLLVPFFASHPFARQVLLTKSATVEQLLGLDHRGRTILSWTLNPPTIALDYERNVPPVEQRLEAMRRCAEAGYPLRAVIMPLIPHPDWERLYGAFLEQLLTSVPLQRLTLGGVCIYSQARWLMESQLGRENTISSHLRKGRDAAGDGRGRYEPAMRARMYRHLIEVARSIRPELELSLCLEEANVWEMVPLPEGRGRCNCVW